MNQKNTVDLPPEFGAMLALCIDTNMSVQSAKRLLRRSLRVINDTPGLYCEHTVKYSTLITKDYS